MKMSETFRGWFLFILAMTEILVVASRGAGNGPAGSEAGMVHIAGGEYVPLDTKDAAPRKVDGFRMDVRAVTNGEFLEFVRSHPKWRKSRVPATFADANYLKHWAGDLDLGPEGEAIADSPVTNVSWFAAKAYCEAQGKRLPTVDEWEFAARADLTREDATGSGEFNRRLLDWYSKPATEILPAAGDAEANVYGVRGLHGVIWEWVLDFNNAMVTGESRGDGGLDRKLYCAGGAVGATDVSNYAAFMRYAFRASLKGNYTVGSLGFRGVKDEG